MADKKQISEAEIIASPPLHMVLGDMPFQDPDWRCKTDQKPRKLDPSMEGTVKRLIAHLKDEK